MTRVLPTYTPPGAAPPDGATATAAPAEVAPATSAVASPAPASPVARARPRQRPLDRRLMRADAVIASPFPSIGDSPRRPRVLDQIPSADMRGQEGI